MDEIKFTSAISNLVENAIKYNVDDGWVRVSIDADHKYFFLCDCGRFRYGEFRKIPWSVSLRDFTVWTNHIPERSEARDWDLPLQEVPLPCIMA